MAISVVTDLVLDVMKAGHADKIQAADAKLKAMSSNSIEIASAYEKFATELVAAETKSDVLSNSVDLRNKLETSKSADAYKKFEAVVLEQFVQHMLPKDSSVIFGEGTAGDMWKGLMAQHLGDAIVKGGGIGIAGQLANSPGHSNINYAANIIFNQERDVLDSLSSPSQTENER